MTQTATHSRQSAGQTNPEKASFKIWNTAIYVRLSRENNLNDSDSIENQIALLENYIAGQADLRKIDVFADNGFSGTNFERPAWKTLMAKVTDGSINCIIMKDLSRLGRNYIEAGHFIEKICPVLQLRFIAVNDGLDTEKPNANSQLSVPLHNIINDYYAKDISRKVSSALRDKMEEGKYIGSWEKYGYLKDPADKNHLIINEETAPIVRMIYEWRSEGMSYMGINKRLNDMGIPSPGQYKANRGIVTNNNRKNRIILWNKHVLKDILQDITYLGHLAQRKTTQCLYGGIPFSRTDKQDWITVRNTHEPIISQELFDTVQAINTTAAETCKKNHGKYDYLPKAVNVYGKKFTCADCGAVMKLTRSISTKKDKAYFTFKCPTYAEHGDQGCTAKKMRQADVDAAVLSAIRIQFDLFLDTQEALHRLLKLKQKQMKKEFHKDEEQKLKKEINHQKSLLSGLYVDLKEGILTPEDYTDHRNILMDKIHRLENQLAEFQHNKDDVQGLIHGEEKWKASIKKYYNAEEVTAELVEATIESMQMSADNTLHITFRHMDEFHTMMNTLDNLKEV